MDAVELGEKFLFPVKYVSEGVCVPKFNAVREFLHSPGNVVGVVIPRILDDGWKGGIVEPNGF